MDLKYSIALFVAAAMVLSVTGAAAGLSQANGKDIERVDFIHYYKAKGGGNSAKAASCYKLMGVKWGALPVSYVINPTNSQGLSVDFITATMSTSAETWDAATSKELFNNAFTTNNSVNYGVKDGVNAIAFGNYPQSGVIAVTSIWMDKRTKQIVEFDMLYDTDFSWGDATIDPLKMDLENIATHELGHAVGLSDLYTQSCSAVTMYGYSNNGDIAKRTLEQPDVTGLAAMYGA